MCLDSWRRFGALANGFGALEDGFRAHGDDFGALGDGFGSRRWFGALGHGLEP